MSRIPEAVDLPVPNSDELDLLRHALVKLSLAAAGQHRRLDLSLERLRLVIKKGGDTTAVQQEVDAITDVLREVGDEIDAVRQQAALMPVSELFDAFLQLPLPNGVADELRVLKSRPPSARAIVAALAPALRAEHKPSFWERLRGRRNGDDTAAAASPATETVRDPQPAVSDLAAPLLRLLDNLELPPAARDMLRELRAEALALRNAHELPPLFEEVSALVLDAAAVEQAQFEQFLLSVNQRLSAVQDALSTGAQRDAATARTSDSIDAEMRAQLAGLKAGFADVRDVSDLQARVEAQLDGLLDCVARLSSARSERQQQRSDETSLLREQLRATEDEAARLRETLAEQRNRAQTDPLTGLANRHAYHDRISQEFARWKRYRGKLALVVADIDLFKQVNDTHGHLVGDAVLKHVAGLLKAGLRDADFLGRFGGEEFVMLMPETGLVDATKAINKLRLRIAQTPWTHADQSLTVTVSFGVAEFEGEDVPRDVFHRADRALYRAKRKGRNTVCCERRDHPGEDLAE